MSDLETRVSAALAAGASTAPTSTVGLADGARRRLRRRRRTRGVVGGVLAVLMVVVPLGVWGRSSPGPPPAPSPAPSPEIVTAWRTLAYAGTRVDVPATWDWLDTSACGFERRRAGPSGVHPCDLETGVTFYGAALFDPADLPGLRAGGGYVLAGDQAVFVHAADPAVGWRVLASARAVGEMIPDLSAGSTVVVRRGVGMTVPADPTGWSIAVTAQSGPRWASVGPNTGGSFSGAVGIGPGLRLNVTATTQAVAELVLASVESATPDDGWRTESWHGLSADVPADWEPGVLATYCAADGSPEHGLVQRPDTEGREPLCRRPSYGFGISFGSSAAYDTVYPSGHVWQYIGGHEYVEGSWLGHWYDDERLVRVNAGDRATVERILASIEVQSDSQ